MARAAQQHSGEREGKLCTGARCSQGAVDVKGEGVSTADQLQYLSRGLQLDACRLCCCDSCLDALIVLWSMRGGLHDTCIGMAAGSPACKGSSTAPPAGGAQAAPAALGRAPTLPSSVLLSTVMVAPASSTTLRARQSRCTSCRCCSAARWRRLPLPPPPLLLPAHRAPGGDGSCAAAARLRVRGLALLQQAAGATVESCMCLALPWTTQWLDRMLGREQ